MTLLKQKSLEHILIGFHALSDSIRLDILELLKSQELCVCELCDKLKINQSKLSFHLKNLKKAGLILSRQEGKWIYYRLNSPQFLLLEQYLEKYIHSSFLVSAKTCK
jgi:ArsR family transcriptional regulator, arsenate/arsenite/antimonite-responsive transcriptional repressor